MRQCGSPPSYKENVPSCSVTSAGEVISLGEMMREWKDRRSEVTEGLFRGKNLLQCLIGVLLRIAVMWWISLSVYLYATYLSLAIKQPFRENTTGHVGTDSSNSFSGMCHDGNCYLIWSERYYFLSILWLHLMSPAWLKLETCVIS